MTDIERMKFINETRRDLARAYNSFFAGATVNDIMLELEKRLMDLLRP
jgi:hypothetical protein